jgi:uncharacterized phage-like protein YoqJ
MIVSFTGHRPNKLGGYQIPNPIYTYIIQELNNILLKLKPEKAISGMALGWDQWAAQTCIDLQIPFIAAIPFVGQEKIWPQTSKDIYNALLQKAVEQVIVCEGGYAAWKMQKRNEWMVDRSNIVIACFDGTNGGTANCIRYAKEKNKELIIINPQGRYE